MAGLCCFVVVAAHAQEALPPGLIATFDVTQRLEYSDNPDLDEDGESDFFGRTILDFGLQSETALETFRLNLGTDIEEGRNDQSTFDATNSFLQLDYDRATRNASVGLALRYRESDVTSDFFDDDFDLDGNVINQDEGTRQSYGFGLDGAVGREAPIGASFTLDYAEVNYNDTDDPDLTDSSDLDFAGQVDFRVDPRITARLTARYGDFDAQGNGVSRETTAFGTGVVLDVTKTLQADIGLSYDRIERSGDETGTDEGVTLNAGLTQTVKNGTWGLQFDSDVTSNDDGRRNFMRLQRSMELPRGRLSYSLGGTNSENSDFDPLLDFDYVHLRPTSQLSFSMSQVFRTDSDNEEQINTTLRAGYRQQINSLSSLGADLSFFDRNELGADANDGQRIDVSLTYDYALTRDWGLVGGISHILSTSDDEDDRSSNTIFVGLRRNFVWTR